jgi:phosphate starvation-inducible protein PhoH and related proteins
LTSSSQRAAAAETALFTGGKGPQETTLSFDDNKRASLVLGQYDQNLAHIERRLAIVATVNGNHLTLKGSREGMDRAKRTLDLLYEQARSGKAFSKGDIDGALQEVALQGQLFPQASAENGKTWLAVGHAVQLMEQGLVERLILSRPAVEAGERLGFLPGDMKDKVDPYLRPIYDALYDFMEARIVERGLQTGQIEVAPLAFMRGRTLSNAVILLDEAQNTTSMQMKMFLTRLGEGSRMIITGDPTQIDLPPGQKSGLTEAVTLLTEVDGVGHVRFGHEDVVRHDLVRRIVKAYEDAGGPHQRRMP